MLRKLFVDDINKLIGTPSPPLEQLLLSPLSEHVFHMCLNRYTSTRFEREHGARVSRVPELRRTLAHMKHAERHTVDVFESMRFICAEIATHTGV